MNTSVSSKRDDQAVGLRKMFTSDRPQIHVFACPTRPSAVLPLTQMFALDLASKGRRVLWVDEIDFPDREGWPLPAQVPFDLQHALEGDVSLDKAVVPVNSHFWYALARRKSSASSVTLSQRLARSGVEFDIAIVSARCKPEDSYLHYKPDVKMTLLAGVKATPLSRTLAWVQNVYLSTGVEVARVAFVGGASSGSGAQLWQDMRAQLLPAGQVQEPPVSLIPDLPAKTSLAALWSKQTLFLEQLQRDIWNN